MALERDVSCINLGRWGRVELRLHVAFLLAILLVILVAWKEAPVGEAPPWGAVATLTFLWLVSVLGHELGHLLVTYPVADELESVTLLPWGGLRRMRSSSPVSHHLVPLVTGPMVSLAMALFCYALLQTRHAGSLAELIQPASLSSLWNQEAGGGSYIVGVLRAMVTINAWIVLLNLIPAYPFDGAWVCATALQRARRDWDARRSTVWMVICSRGVALLVLIAAVVMPANTEPTVFPDWWLMLLLALTIFFAARGEEYRLTDAIEDRDELGYDFSQGYTSLERSAAPAAPPPTAWQRCWTRLHRRWQARRSRLEAEEDARVDSILVRLHERGMDGLTPDERALLRRVSARYRNRQSS